MKYNPNLLYMSKIKNTNIDFVFFVDRFLGYGMATTGIWEEEITNFLIDDFCFKNKKYSGNVIHIGANMGYYVRLLGKLCPNLESYSFEPHPEIYKVLKINSRDLKNAYIYQYAISNFRGVCKFYCNDLNSGHNYLCLDDSYKNDEAGTIIEVPVKRITDFNIKFKETKLIIIDIEKNHQIILEELQNLILPGTVVIVENNDIDPEFINNNYIKDKMDDKAITKFNSHILYKKVYNEYLSY